MVQTPKRKGKPLVMIQGHKGEELQLALKIGFWIPSNALNLMGCDYPFQELLKPLGPSRCRLAWSNTGEETSRSTVISPWPPVNGAPDLVSSFPSHGSGWFSRPGAPVERCLPELWCPASWPGVSLPSPRGSLDAWTSGFSLSSSGCEIKCSLCSPASFQCLFHFTCMCSTGFWQGTLYMKPQLKAISNETLLDPLWEWKEKPITNKSKPLKQSI